MQNGVRFVPWGIECGNTCGIHPSVSDFETKVIRGEAFFRAAPQLRSEGKVPDLVIAHHGWGETLLVEDVGPGTRLAPYCGQHLPRAAPLTCGGNGIEISAMYPRAEVSVELPARGNKDDRPCAMRATSGSCSSCGSTP